MRSERERESNKKQEFDHLKFDYKSIGNELAINEM